MASCSPSAGPTLAALLEQVRLYTGDESALVPVCIKVEEPAPAH